MSVALRTLLPDTALPSNMAELPVSGLSMDSRVSRAGDLFFAIPGERHDGRRFIHDAVRHGAGVVLAEQDVFSVTTDGKVPVVGVPGLRRQVGEIAGRFYGRPADKMKVMGVTGTNGKTSIAWFLRRALEAAGEPCALIGTLGMSFRDQKIDTGHTTPDPLTLHAGLARFAAAGAGAVVMEVSSHALDQHRLSGVPVALAIFSNLSRDHLDYHSDMNRYFAAKARLFTEHKPSVAVINMDDPRGRQLADMLSADTRLIGFSLLPGHTVYCETFQANPRGIDCRLNVDGESIALSLPLFGRFNLENLLAVAGALHGAGLVATQIVDAMSAITPVPGRMQPVSLEARPRVLVDYAHTPAALEKALLAAREHFDGRIHCVFGCGGDRDKGKRPEMAAVAEEYADHLTMTSDNPRSESPEAILDDMQAGLRAPHQARRMTDRPAAIAAAVAAADADDLVLIAGKGHETWQEMAGRRVAMDDLALARQALDALPGGDQ